MAKSPKLSQEVKGFLDEANAASDPARTAWLAFLLLLTYVVVTLASVSHKDLLLNSPVRLPIINADIPLVGFFQYAPAMLLLVYLSLLVQHVILARKYRRFTDALAAYELKARTRHVARERVHSYVFSQILAGPEANRITRLMMQLIVYVTFAVLPIVTLLYFQIKFLPFHEVWITYWHRFAVILGFAMLDPAHADHAACAAEAKMGHQTGTAGGSLGGFGPAGCARASAAADRRRLQLVDRHGSRRMDRSASRVCCARNRRDRCGGRGEAVEPHRPASRL